MNRCISYIVLIAGVSSGMCQRVAFGDVLANEQNSDVSITITKFQVNDRTLELSLKIINDTDHDIWICDSVNTDGVRDFEVFMAEDNQTLVVRRRFDLNPDQAGFERFFKGRYIRFGPGQERTESLSFTIPPPRQTWFEGETGYAPYAKRLAIEIGYYNEDLRELLVNIINVGEKLDCDSDIFFSSFEEELAYYQFFGGFVIAEVFKSSDPSPRGSPVYDPVYDGGEEISMYHMGYVHMGEKVLRATINDVSIPCHLDPQSEPKPAGVTMAFTGFDVNDAKLELSWKIINNTDHDVWICDGLTTGYFECVLDKDNETLKIIKRSSLPQGPGWEHYPWIRFIRLRPGQDKEDSISLTVPVRPYTEFSHQRGNAEYARRVAIEIDFFDEDLRGLILGIVDLTEQLNCDINLLSTVVAPESQILKRFFTGVYIAQVFHDESFRGFQNKVLSDGDEISMPFMGQLFHGEKVLRATIDGVSIPYKSNYPPLNDEPALDETEPAEVTMALTGFEMNDIYLNLDYNIINNTDHDVWICDSVDKTSPSIFERFLDEDARTIVIRKRYDLPMRQQSHERSNPASRYIRLRAGQEKAESIFIALPVEPYCISAGESENAEYAERVALEIGFYDEALPALILRIVELAEFLNCDLLVGLRENVELGERFFGGRQIAQYYYHIIGFGQNVRSADADGEMWMLHMGETRMGEKVLLVEVDGVSIPYKSNYPPLND